MVTVYRRNQLNATDQRVNKLKRWEDKFAPTVFFESFALQKAQRPRNLVTMSASTRAMHRAPTRFMVHETHTCV